MKKFFSFTIAIFMLISMVSLVGCNGLWDFDDDDDVTLMPVKFNFVGKLALGSSTNNIRAAAISDYTVYTGNVYYEGDTTTALNENPITVDNVGSFTVDFTAYDGRTFYIVFEHATNPNALKLYRYFNKRKADMDSYDATTPAVINEETTAVGIILQSDPEKKYGDVKEEDVSDTTSDVYKLVQTITGMGNIDEENFSVAATAVAITNADPLSMIMGGEAVELKATPDPVYTTDTLVWTIDSGAAFITLSGSTVTPVAEGTAVVKVTAGSVSDTITINVTAADVAVTSISVADASVAVGSTVTLTPTVLPANASDKTVTWTSATPAVASVNSTTGVVTGVSAGTAVITATASDGSGVTGNCTVTVTAAPTTTTATFDSTISGATTGMTIVLYNAGNDYSGTCTLKDTDDEDVTFEVNSIYSDGVDGGVVLSFGSTKPLADFDSITFSSVLPSGTVVKLAGVTGNPEVTIP